MTNSNTASQIENKKDSLALQDTGLGDLISSFAYSHNYAYIVTVILSKIGMDRTQNNIEDSGALQNQISKGQSQLATMQQFMSLLEGNTQWDSAKNQGYWPPYFTGSQLHNLQNFIQSFGQFYFNTKSPDADPSTTSVDLNIDITLQSGTKLIINPTADSVLDESSGKIYSGGGPYAGVLNSIRTYITNVSQYVVGEGSIPEANTTVPQYLALAMSELQSKIDASPSKFISECVNGSSSIQTFAGSVDSDPLMSAAEQLYSSFAAAKSTGSITNTVAEDLQWYYESPSEPINLMWNDLGSMMSAWITNKMSNQSSSGTPPTLAPWTEMLVSNGVTDVINTAVAGAIAAIEKALGDINAWGGPWTVYSKDLKTALADLQNNPTSSDIINAWGEVETVGGLIPTNPALDPPNQPASRKADILQSLTTASWFLRGGGENAIDDPGLFNQAQSAISMGSSTYQSQTQQNSAAVQQETSMLTSYDQIGQSIISAVQKSEQTIAGNLKSS